MATMNFGLISKTIWHSQRFRALKDPVAKLIYHYLHTNEHRNSAGCFVLKKGYAAYDLDISVEDFDRGMHRAIDSGLALYDEKHEIVLILEFFRFNPATNPKHAAGIRKCLARLPSCEITQKAINTYNEHALKKGYETITCGDLKGYDRGIDSPMDTPIDTPMDRGMHTTGTREHVREEIDKLSLVICEQSDVDVIKLAVQAYAKVAKRHSWPVPRNLNQNRKAKLRARLKDVDGLDGWTDAMKKAGESGFLNGSTRTDNSWPGPNIDFFLRESTFTKLIEGTYDNRGQTSNPGGFNI